MGKSSERLNGPRVGMILPDLGHWATKYLPTRYLLKEMGDQLCKSNHHIYNAQPASFHKHVETCLVIDLAALDKSAILAASNQAQEAAREPHFSNHHIAQMHDP
jgi:hypothetical protein